MSETFKEFEQKIKNRKFAIDNSWRGELEDKEAEYRTAAVSSENISEQALPWELLNENLEAANECKFFDGYLPLASNRKILGRWIILLKRIIRRLLKIFMGWYIFPQYQRMSHFNGKIVNALSLERDILSSTVQQNQQIVQQLNEYGAKLQTTLEYLKETNQELQKRLEEAILDNKSLHQQKAAMQNDIQDLKKSLMQLCADTNALHQQHFDIFKRMQKLSESQVTLFESNERMQQQNVELQNKTLKLHESQMILSDETSQLNSRIRKIENLPTDDDEFYHCFEEKFRGSQETIKERLQIYIPYIQEHITDWGKANFIDVGSGRGEWLDILRENGALNYVGVDFNARQNALCKARGHNVIQTDCIEYLKTIPENSIDLITGFQIIEHLCMSDLMELFRQSYRVLKHGGIILFETQNPRNLIVGADTFYIDPSHKRPLEPRLISFLAEWCGYISVTCIDADSYPNWAGPTIKSTNKEIQEITDTIHDINYQLYGPQDYAVMGIKE